VTRSTWYRSTSQFLAYLLFLFATARVPVAGNIHLNLASDASFDLDAHTNSGNISVSQPVSVQGSMGRKELRGKVHGGGVPVEVETGSGNIEIQ
jgi:DUF4097 and DUF4098 domain-containing protein YvlB